MSAEFSEKLKTLGILFELHLHTIISNKKQKSRNSKIILQLFLIPIVFPAHDVVSSLVNARANRETNVIEKFDKTLCPSGNATHSP